MHRINPHMKKIGEGGEIVIRRQKLGLEPAHLAGRCAAALDGLAADYPTHRGIASEPVGVIHIFISGKTTID
jgi:hypothetical protein